MEKIHRPAIQNIKNAPSTMHVIYLVDDRLIWLDDNRLI